MNQSRFTPAALLAASTGDLGNLVATMTPGGIQAQEKQGQIEQAMLETLPRDMKNYRPMLEQLGFVFGEFADELFINCTFPEGWQKRCTDHSMWSDLVDDKGRKRGSIFYKAAFYDMKAHFSMSTRFGVGCNYSEDGTTKELFIDDACGEVEMRKGPFPRPDWRDNHEQAQKEQDAYDAAERELEAWLDENYPDHKSPLAYW